METLVQQKLQAALEAKSNSDNDDLLETVFRFDVASDLQTNPNLSLIERRKSASLQAEDGIQAVLVKAEIDAGEAPVEVSVFPALSSAFVKARPGFIKALIDQSEVLGATLNEEKSMAKD